ncbi:ABC transporter ATP-binding protein [Agathobacter rectalis]|jgi:ABC-2 type transport system ATP-binding protein|uniref:ABC transporter ATP-binding protein n=1 Tax=Agathobacter rectalis TaxID=39491 RepID=A0A395UYR0_9FIRM|nr:ABC transporter ATP-binding protein [Agathobacter rectalis]RGR51596.1 ABC transporter ATP-binding protein [Agathobacter rectalis]RGT78655.1 ABC transporter ATP-binding protein [Agathobacter rectalis]RGT84656.1 ABC transporter ATP-binding protein [Agathobacter rectalis]
MIKGLNISKKYKKFELQPTSIEIDKGEIVALIGENGAGKSTLIKCMCGVIDADEGQLEVDDQVVKKLDDVLVLGFMNQDQNVYNEIKIRDLTNFVKDVMKKKFDQEVYYYYFKDVFHLDDDYKMKELSTGMKVKYFLSLELAKNPDLLVLDEPTSGLDPIVRDEVLDILRCVAKEKNTSVLFSSHITEDIEKIADRVIFINNGRIVLQGDKKEIKKKYVKLNQQQYVILVNAGMAKECVSIHDYYIVDRDLAMTCNVEVKEALLSDILSYMRKKSED